MISFRLNLFDMAQRVYVDDKIAAVTNVQDCAHDIAIVAQQFGENEIHLFGNEKYLDDVKFGIINYSKSLNNFSADKIEIYINE